MNSTNEKGWFPDAKEVFYRESLRTTIDLSLIASLQRQDLNLDILDCWNVENLLYSHN